MKAVPFILGADGPATDAHFTHIRDRINDARTDFGKLHRISNPRGGSHDAFPIPVATGKFYMPSAPVPVPGFDGETIDSIGEIAVAPVFSVNVTRVTWVRPSVNYNFLRVEFPNYVAVEALWASFPHNGIGVMNVATIHPLTSPGRHPQELAGAGASWVIAPSVVDLDSFDYVDFVATGYFVK
jgi:hypothetical protein